MASTLQRWPVRVLVLGGSYGGMSAALNLADLCTGRSARSGLENPRLGCRIPVEITVVDERDGYYHLIGSPLALADENYAEKTWVKFENIPALKHEQFRFIHGSVQRVHMGSKIALVAPYGASGIESVTYDYLVAATGLRRSWPSVPQALARREYLAEVRPHIAKVSKAEHGVAVIGGGAVGIEMAAELKMVSPDLRVVLVHSRDKLLSSEPLPDEFREKALALLHEAGVETIMGKRVQQTIEDASSGKRTLHLSDSSQLTVTEAIDAVSRPKPTTSYLPNEIVSAEGEVLINSNLTFPQGSNYSDHFAIGDIIPETGIKRCGGAMHGGNFAAYNIHQQILFSHGLIDETKFHKMPSNGPNIGLAVGKKAIGYSKQTGIMADDETMKYLFGDDLGFKYCWDYLKMSEETLVTEAAETDGLPDPQNLTRNVEDTAVAVPARA